MFLFFLNAIPFAPAEGVVLPKTATVKLSAGTNSTEGTSVDSTVDLDSVTLGPGQAVLLQFPYTG